MARKLSKWVSRINNEPLSKDHKYSIQHIFERYKDQQAGMGFIHELVNKIIDPHRIRQSLNDRIGSMKNVLEFSNRNKPKIATDILNAMKAQTERYLAPLIQKQAGYERIIERKKRRTELQTELNRHERQVERRQPNWKKQAFYNVLAAIGIVAGSDWLSKFLIRGGKDSNLSDLNSNLITNSPKTTWLKNEETIASQLPKLKTLKNIDKAISLVELNVRNALLANSKIFTKNGIDYEQLDRKMLPLLIDFHNYGHSLVELDERLLNEEQKISTEDENPAGFRPLYYTTTKYKKAIEHLREQLITMDNEFTLAKTILRNIPYRDDRGNLQIASEQIPNFVTLILKNNPLEEFRKTVMFSLEHRERKLPKIFKFESPEEEKVYYDVLKLMKKELLKKMQVSRN